MNPKHINPRTDERTAHAPYNFVPLPDAVVQAPEALPHDSYHRGCYTGVIDCTLTTETPLYIKAALELGEYGVIEAKDKPDFFYLDPNTREPVIPGSSLRGMLRNLVEIATYSKLQPVTARQLFFRTLDDTSIGRAYGKRMSGEIPGKGWYPIASAGYIERHGLDYYIRPAQKIYGTQHYRVEERLARAAIPDLAEMAFFNRQRERWSPNRRFYKWKRVPIWFKPVIPTSHLPESYTYFAEVTELDPGQAQPGEGWVRGCLIASGWVPSRDGPGKHRHWIVGPPVEDNDSLIRLDDVDIEAYREEGAGLSKDIKDRNMSVLPQKEGEQVACFFTHWQDSEGRKRIAFGHTGMFRLPYELSPRDLLADYLKDASTTDMAEALFGQVDTQGRRQIAGRVSVGDAVLAEGQSHIFVLAPDEPPIRALLSGPKPTTFQHYLVQVTDVKGDLYHYADRADTTLRGHKLYWHKDDTLKREDYDDTNWTPDSTQHASLRPVAANITFAFELRFENLSAPELGALLWVLKIAGTDQQRLKLGMGKPLGLGTVKVKSALLTLSDRRQRYKTLYAEWMEPPKDAEKRTNALRAEVLAEVLTTLPESLRSDVASLEEAFILAFESFMWHELPAGVKDDASDFRSLPRIRALLALLRWPGPERKLTRHQTIQPNQYRPRPVLPDPLAVLADQSAQPSTPARQVPPPPDTPPAQSAQPPVTAAPRQAVAPTSPVPELSQPAPAAEVVPGMYVEGTVVRAESTRLIVDVDGQEAVLWRATIHPPLPDSVVLRQRFPAGSKIHAWVKGRSEGGSLQLTMTPPTG